MTVKYDCVEVSYSAIGVDSTAYCHAIRNNRTYLAFATMALDALVPLLPQYERCMYKTSAVILKCSEQEMRTLLNYYFTYLCTVVGNLPKGS